MAGIELQNVRKSFGSIDVIRDVCLSIEQGEFGVFVGPSGCGKSTLLRMIAGLEDTTAGSIRIGGRDVTQTEPAKRGVSMVFQSYALYPHLSVAENMAFSMRIAKTPRAEREAKVREAARILQLTEHLDKKPSQLSGGQRQRVAIGRAIVRAPDVFLFDEPLSNLDAELRVQMRLELSRLHREIGATMIYVTHDQVEAMTLADKIFVLKGGVVQQAGPPLTLYDHPSNRFVAGFIGSPAMNFIRGTVRGQDKGLLRIATSAGDVSAQINTGLGMGTSVVVGMRPEHLVPSEQGLRVTVEMAEELGALAFVHAHTADGTEVVFERRGLRVRLDGTQVHLGIDPAQVYCFTPDGERLY